MNNRILITSEDDLNEIKQFVTTLFLENENDPISLAYKCRNWSKINQPHKAPCIVIGRLFDIIIAQELERNGFLSTTQSFKDFIAK